MGDAGGASLRRGAATGPRSGGIYRVAHGLMASVERADLPAPVLGEAFHENFRSREEPFDGLGYARGVRQLHPPGRRLDAFCERLRGEFADPDELQSRARRVVESMALALRTG